MTTPPSIIKGTPRLRLRPTQIGDRATIAALRSLGCTITVNDDAILALPITQEQRRRLQKGIKAGLITILADVGCKRGDLSDFLSSGKGNAHGEEINAAGAK